ncbi:unnamed protein product [Rotaria sordida]|uniref:Apple domain-containing protein n=1 Tax=Rotaria sordida TaxID=392033 RepID=A0A814VF86_9BILA|nr:unnamed protein product [Rotaria sordida]
MVPDNMLLEPPFEGACLYPKITEPPRRRWYSRKIFFIPVSVLATMLIIAVVLGSVLGSRSANNAPVNTCDGFVRHENWDIYGNDISLVGGVINYATCCSICRANKECAAFVYSPSSKECWSKKSVESGGIFNDKKISGYKVNVCNDFVSKDRWNIPGNDILSSSVQQPDYASCCSTCQAIYGCFAFTYSPSSQQCWPKTSMSSENMCDGLVRKDGWDIPGNDILSSPVQQPDYASCCSKCQATPECIAFTYSPSSQRCSLKTSMRNGGNSTGDTITGYRFLPLRASLIDIHPNAKWSKNGITIAGGNGQGSGINQFSKPCGLYVDDDQTIYVADQSNHRVVEWKWNATSGQVVAGGNGQGIGDHQLNNPYDVIIDKETDSLLVCDNSNKRVVRWPRRNGTSGETISSNISCVGLTMDENGSLYVSDNKINEVRRYLRGESQGTVIAGGNEYGNGLNQLAFPQYLFIDRDHSVYVSEWNNPRVMKWTEGAKEGIIVAGDQGQGNGLTQLSSTQGVVVDQLGTVYVADFLNDRIMRWPRGAKEGSIIVGGNGQGNQSNQLNRPVGLSFDRHGNLYVVEWENHRVQKFNIESNK